MKNYYFKGRGAWHTAEASTAHEDYHYFEWQTTGDHYWPATETAIENITVPYHLYNTEAAAISALQAGTSGANAKIVGFTKVSRDYWFTLSDTAPSRPYAAGQLTLNNAITTVQSLAVTNSWTVPQGTNSPSISNPCYQNWLPYSP